VPLGGGHDQRARQPQESRHERWRQWRHPRARLPMAEGGATVRWLGKRRVAPANLPTSITHRNPWRNAQTEGYRPVSACVYGEVRCGQTWCADNVTRRRVPGRVQAFQGSSVWPNFTRKLSTKVHQGLNTKLAHLTPNFIGVLSIRFCINGWQTLKFSRRR
jgi:hypothetical protein